MVGRMKLDTYILMAVIYIYGHNQNITLGLHISVVFHTNVVLLIVHTQDGCRAIVRG